MEGERSVAKVLSIAIAVAALSITLALGAHAAEEPAKKVNQNWATVGGSNANTRYSALARINTSNVGRLSGGWFRELAAKTRTPPVVVDGVLYIADAARIYALNGKNGDTLWEYTPTNGAPAREGVAVADGKVFCGLSDAHVIALEARSGRPIWTSYIGNVPAGAKGSFSFVQGMASFDPKSGSITAAPTYINGKVILGLSGGDAGTRSKVAALDAETGQLAWEWRDIIPSSGQPGSESWPADSDPTKIAGGAVWTHAAADSQLGLIYYGTGNAVPMVGGEVRAGDNLYMASVVALDVATGKLKWFYQLTHHDIWEMDVSMPIILYDARVRGQTRKALAVMRNDGYLFRFDRATGQPISPIEERPVKQDIRQRTALTQPYPLGTDQVGPNCVEPELMASGFVAGCYFDPPYHDRPNVLTPMSNVRIAPMAFDPRTGYFYVAAGATPWWLRRMENPYVSPLYSLRPPGTREYGLMAAIDSRTGKIAWQKRTPWSLISGSGMMTTAGGLLFRMEADGNFLAFDAKTGNELWRFQTGSISSAAGRLTGGVPSAAYEFDGEQYISVPSGKGLWGFKLGGSIHERPAPPAPPTEASFVGIVESIAPGGEIAMAVLHDSGPPYSEHFIDETAFSPGRSQLPAGQPVKFTNYGIKNHTIVSADGSWTTGPVLPGESAMVTITRPGKYIFFATEFPWAKGQLIVQ